MFHACWKVERSSKSSYYKAPKGFVLRRYCWKNIYATFHIVSRVSQNRDLCWNERMFAHPEQIRNLSRENYRPQHLKSLRWLLNVVKYQIHLRSDTQTRDQETKLERIYKLCQETVEECIYQSMAVSGLY